MAEDTNTAISPYILEQLYKEFVQFLKEIAGEDFVSFKSSKYVIEQENYKDSIYQEAKHNLGSKFWTLDDIGTGGIQKAVNAAILSKVIHNSVVYENNLINWRKKDEFAKLGRDKGLEQLFFNFYKNKIKPENAFPYFQRYFDYQLIAYLFFINNKEQFLPISQNAFDKIFEDKLRIPNFKTSGNVSWENYKTFNDIIKEVHRFLKTKVKEPTLLDAHSFLWILGRQREKWLTENNPTELVSIPNQSQISVISQPSDIDINVENVIVSSVEVSELPEETKKISEKFENENELKQFTPADIIWVKNVTDHNVGQAYMKLAGEELDKFVLLFPDQHKSNILSPQVGEIILLRQYVNGISAFTHLVTPINDELVEENIHSGFSCGRNVRVIAMTPMDNLIEASSTNWKDVFTRGNAIKIEKIYKHGSIDSLQLGIWERFKPFFVNNQLKSLELTSELLKEIETSDDYLTVTEGKLRLVAHYARERNSEIVEIKKQQAISSNTLYCEVCSFSFIETYNVEFIECHHRTPISQTGVTKTTLNDLALLCANCHRMLHKKIDGNFLSIEELRIRLKR
jgi:hypothetical protein